ncbi:MAG: hypothetical protein FVQ80_17180 [Planctomycetes bacterium]|nr:hypothetical protein [Planctomycetota bacterium]
MAAPGTYRCETGTLYETWLLIKVGTAQLFISKNPADDRKQLEEKIASFDLSLFLIIVQVYPEIEENLTNLKNILCSCLLNTIAVY